MLTVKLCLVVDKQMKIILRKFFTSKHEKKTGKVVCISPDYTISVLRISESQFRN